MKKLPKNASLDDIIEVVNLLIEVNNKQETDMLDMLQEAFNEVERVKGVYDDVAPEPPKINIYEGDE